MIHLINEKWSGWIVFRKKSKEHASISSSSSEADSWWQQVLNLWADTRSNMLDKRLKGKNCDSLSASTMLFWPLNRGTRVCLQGSIKLYLNMTHIHTCMLRPVEKTKSSEGCELMSDPDVSAVADYHFIWINVCVCACVCGLLWDQNWSKQSGVFLLVASSCSRLLS